MTARLQPATSDSASRVSWLAHAVAHAVRNTVSPALMFPFHLCTGAGPPHITMSSSSRFLIVLKRVKFKLCIFNGVSVLPRPVQEPSCQVGEGLHYGRVLRARRYVGCGSLRGHSDYSWTIRCTMPNSDRKKPSRTQTCFLLFRCPTSRCGSLCRLFSGRRMELIGGLDAAQLALQGRQAILDGAGVILFYACTYV